MSKILNRQTIIYSLFWKFFERCSVQIISFIVTIVLARLLDPNEYGTIALVLVFVNVAGVIVEGGLNTALIQKKNSDQLDFSTIFYASILVSGILYFILYLSAPWIASFYNTPSLELVVKVLGISLLFYAVNSIQKSFLTKHFQFKKMFYSSLWGVTISGVIGIYLAWLGYGIWALVMQSVLIQVFTTIIMGFTVKWTPSLQFSWNRFKNLFNFGWKILVTNLLINLTINVRSLLIGKVYNASSLALFDRGKQFPALIIDNINTSIQSVIFPVLSNLQDNKDSVKSMVQRSIRTSTFVIFPLVVVLGVLAEPLILSLLTDKWLGAVPYVRIFCCAYFFMPMQIANLEAIKSLGFSGTTLKLEILKKGVELLILVITIRTNVELIAWGVVLYNILTLIINIRPNSKFLNYGFSNQIKDVIPSLIISLLMGVLLFLLTLIPVQPIFKLTGGLISALVIYWILAAITHNETYLYLKDILFERLSHKL